MLYYTTNASTHTATVRPMLYYTTNASTHTATVRPMLYYTTNTSTHTATVRPMLYYTTNASTHTATVRPMLYYTTNASTHTATVRPMLYYTTNASTHTTTVYQPILCYTRDIFNKEICHMWFCLKLGEHTLGRSRWPWHQWQKFNTTSNWSSMGPKMTIHIGVQLFTANSWKQGLRMFRFPKENAR